MASNSCTDDFITSQNLSRTLKTWTISNNKTIPLTVNLEASLPLSQCCFLPADMLQPQVLRIKVLISSQALTKHDSLYSACRKKPPLYYFTYKFIMLCATLSPCVALYSCKKDIVLSSEDSKGRMSQSAQGSWISSSHSSHLFPVSICL